jgi:hypothetical protein
VKSREILTERQWKDRGHTRAEGETKMLASRKTLTTLRILPALVLAFGTLIGCASDDKETNNVTSNAQAPETTSTTQPEDTTVRSNETAALLTNNAPNPQPPSTLEAALAEVDKASIRTHLSRLTGIIPAPLTSGPVTIAERGSENGREATAEYLQMSFARSGVPARILPFTSKFGRGFNVEATLRGSEGGKHLWVTAHLDSVGNAGANDNASGLVSILMTAKVLEGLDLKHTVHLVAYDLEETGLVGSSVYVRNAVGAARAQKGDEAIIGNLNTDMIGYDVGGPDAEIVDCGRGGTIDEAALRASKVIDSPIDLKETCLPGRSDHQRFWEAGLPAIWLFERGEDGRYPWHHENGDTIDKVNVTYLRSTVRLTVATTALLAAPESVD